MDFEEVEIMAEKKEYRSAIRSRRLIREAFQELLGEKPIEKITVTDIVRRADINRSTFYAHYSDVKGLLEEIQDEVMQRSLALIAEQNMQNILRDPKPFMESLVQIGLENVELYRMLSSHEFSLRQIEAMKRQFTERAISSPDIPEIIRQSRSFEIQINFFIGGILHTYLQWLLGNLNCSTEDITAEICSLITNSQYVYRNLLE